MSNDKGIIFKYTPKFMYNKASFLYDNTINISLTSYELWLFNEDPQLYSRSTQLCQIGQVALMSNTVKVPLDNRDLSP